MLDDLKDWLKRKPFSPFKITLTGGHTYEVSSPFQIAIGQTQLYYYYPRSDRQAVLQLDQLVGFEAVEGQA